MNKYSACVLATVIMAVLAWGLLAGARWRPPLGV